MSRQRKSHAVEAVANSKKAAKQSGPDFNPYSTATQAQRVRIIEALRRGSKTTDQLRANGIYWAPARVHELRKAGYDIRTTRVTLWDRDGYPHKGCALYTLHGEPESQP